MLLRCWVLDVALTARKDQPENGVFPTLQWITCMFSGNQAMSTMWSRIFICIYGWHCNWKLGLSMPTQDRVALCTGLILQVEVAIHHDKEAFISHNKLSIYWNYFLSLVCMQSAQLHSTPMDKCNSSKHWLQSSGDLALFSRRQGQTPLMMSKLKPSFIWDSFEFKFEFGSEF
jgi:hypothetical protein